jgi:hypothetical protein
MTASEPDAMKTRAGLEKIMSVAEYVLAPAIAASPVIEVAIAGGVNTRAIAGASRPTATLFMFPPGAIHGRTCGIPI